MSVDAPHRPTTDTHLNAKGEYYNLRVSPEHGLSKAELAAHKPLQKTVDIILQTIEGNSRLFNGKTPVKVNDWDNTYIPANSPQKRYFATDKNGRRAEEVSPNNVERTQSMAKIGDDVIPVKAVNFKGGVNYWQIDPSGRPVQTPDRKPTIVNPDVVYPSKFIDKETGTEVKEFTERLIIRDELEELAAFLCQDLLKKHGDEPHEEKWKDIREVASDVIALLNHPGSHIQAIQKSHLLNTAFAGIKIAKAAIDSKPVNLKIETGFGASDSSNTSNRLISYGIPALEMGASIQDYFDKRRNSRQSAPTEKPVVEFIFAQEAGKAVNFDNNHTAVDARTEGNIAALQKIASECYPQLSVSFRKDVPWSEHSQFTKEYIDYLQRILLEHPDQKVQQTLADLVSFGRKHGDTRSDISSAARYAAAHPPVFGYQPQDFRAPEYYSNEPGANSNDDEVVLVLGGRTERHFNGLMEAALGSCTRAGMMDYLQTTATLENTDVQTELARASLPNPNQVIIGALHDLNESGPAYFVHKIDRPDGHPRAEQITGLTSRVARLTQRITATESVMSKKEAGENQSLAKLRERRFILEGKVKDLSVINAVYKRATIVNS